MPRNGTLHNRPVPYVLLQLQSRPHGEIASPTLHVKTEANLGKEISEMEMRLMHAIVEMQCWRIGALITCSGIVWGMGKMVEHLLGHPLQTQQLCCLKKNRCARSSMMPGGAEQADNKTTVLL